MGIDQINQEVLARLSNISPQTGASIMFSLFTSVYVGERLLNGEDSVFLRLEELVGSLF